MADLRGMSGVRYLAVLLLLTHCAWVSTSVAGETVQQFNYNDDWKIVSAPPPPGPYHTVNVDPRVPGQDVTQPRPGDMMMQEPTGWLPADIDQAPPPAAGHPPVTTRPPSAPRALTPPPATGVYAPRGYGRPPAPVYGRPGPAYSGYRSRPAYPGYGYSYPGGYGSAPREDIPPPSYAVMPNR